LKGSKGCARKRKGREGTCPAGLKRGKMGGEGGAQKKKDPEIAEKKGEQTSSGRDTLGEREGEKNGGGRKEKKRFAILTRPPQQKTHRFL